jgi:hypothetical protein
LLGEEDGISRIHNQTILSYPFATALGWQTVVFFMAKACKLQFSLENAQCLSCLLLVGVSSGCVWKWGELTSDLWQF